MTRHRIIISLVALAIFGPKIFALSNEDIIKMTQSGLSPDVMIAAVKGAAEKRFDTSVEGLIALKSAKVPDAVVAVMVSPQGGATGKTDGLAIGGYFVHSDVVTRADALSAPEIRVGGRAYIPFANLGKVPIYAWFGGASASHVAERGDQVLVSGYDVKPELVRLSVKDGKRYTTITKSGVVVEEAKVKDCAFSRDGHQNWVLTIPKDLPAGEYCAAVQIQGPTTPMFDFGIK